MKYAPFYAKYTWSVVSLLLTGSAFAQDSSALTITNYVVSNIAQESATVSWETDAPSFCTLFYHPGSGDSYSRNVPFNSTAQTDFSLQLATLDADTSYQARISCRDAADNYGSQNVADFRTLAPDPAAPFAARLGIDGPRNVVAGHPLHISVRLVHKTGPFSPTNIEFTGALPAGATLVFEQSNKQSLRYYNPNTTTTVRIDTTGSTPVGQYSLTFGVTNGDFVQSFPFAFSVLSPPSPLPKSPIVEVPPLPQLSKWESDLTTYAGKWCGLYREVNGTDSTALTYHYDSQNVYYQIADYTSRTHWNTCAGYAERKYRDEYVLPNNGAVAGYYTFPDGLYQDYVKTGDAQSLNALKLLGERSAGASVLRIWGIGYLSSREIALILKTYLRLMDVGEDVEEKHIRAANVALGHIDQWFVSKTAGHYKPFMVGLTLSSLIDYYEKTGDDRIPAAVAVAADGLWDCCWLGDRPGATSADQGFFYTSSSLPHQASITPLNAVIAPAYAWLYSHTGNDTYRNRADRIFEAAVLNANAGNIGWAQKQTNQQYNYTFKFVRWRLHPAYADDTPPSEPKELRFSSR